VTEWKKPLDFHCVKKAVLKVETTEKQPKTKNIAIDDGTGLWPDGDDEHSMRLCAKQFLHDRPGDRTTSYEANSHTSHTSWMYNTPVHVANPHLNELYSENEHIYPPVAQIQKIRPAFQLECLPQL
jgi:hypothetical protein